MRPIDADALRAFIVSSLADCCSVGRDTYEEGLEDMLMAVDEAPTVEPKVSEWLEDSDPGEEYGTTWACRKCMHSIHEPYIWNPYYSGYKYCFHCGAKMDGDGNAR